MKKNLIAMKNYAVENKTVLLVTATALLGTVVVAQRAGLKQHDEFLTEKGLITEFYNTED